MLRSKRIFLLSICATLLLSSITNAAAVRADDGWDSVPRVTHVPILMYHYISTPPADGDRFIKDLAVTAENFRLQMQWLKDQGYTAISPDDLMAALWHGKPLPKMPVMMTFDDGYVDAYANAAPILKQMGFTGTFFIVTDWIDQNKPGYLSWDMVKAMSRAGFSIENHSRTHEDFRNRSHDWYDSEILVPIKDIQAHTGIFPRFFCFPYGGYDNIAIEELAHDGVVAAFTENDSRYEYASNTMRLPRVRIRGSMNLADFVVAVTDSR